MRRESVLPLLAIVAVVSLIFSVLVIPRVLEHLGFKGVLAGGMLLLAAGLVIFARAPLKTTGHFFRFPRLVAHPWEEQGAAHTIAASQSFLIHLDTKMLGELLFAFIRHNGRTCSWRLHEPASFDEACP